MELTLARDYGDGVDLTLSGRIEELLPMALAQPRASISIESAPSLKVPLGFRYLYSAPSGVLASAVLFSLARDNREAAGAE